MYFQNFKKTLRHMSAFHADTSKSEEERYALALVELLTVLRDVQDAAFDQHIDGDDEDVLDRFDYFDVREWLLRDWIRTFSSKTPSSLWNTICRCDEDIIEKMP